MIKFGPIVLPHINLQTVIFMLVNGKVIKCTGKALLIYQMVINTSALTRMAIRCCHSDFHYLIKIVIFWEFCFKLILRRATTPSLRAVNTFRLPFSPRGSLSFSKSQFSQNYSELVSTYSSLTSLFPKLLHLLTVQIIYKNLIK